MHRWMLKAATKTSRKNMIFTWTQMIFPNIFFNYCGGFKVRPNIFQYSFFYEVGLNSPPPECGLDLVTHFYPREYERREKNSNFYSGETGSHHLNQVMKVYITSTESWSYDAAQRSRFHRKLKKECFRPALQNEEQRPDYQLCIRL